MLQSNGVKFSIIDISETWLTDSNNLEFITIPDYEVYVSNIKCKKDGGVALYVQTEITHKCILEGTYTVEGCFEVETKLIKPNCFIFLAYIDHQIPVLINLSIITLT